ncbi:MAG: MucB/RseB C-terminal domain-containing protein [Chromatiaceae bacterium]|nr:MucB/RseB C-terminal domain-containing protein [Gammaproteobacteria bacterium]MCB1878428.1 MucB/RseB C-terminal domain-containing protein [Gammaproteobacteria bacterium]MCP5428300.1 MucB/RseB C-terminal domain-containing protein [Chromatiaceae bacterium]MCP5448820.1 MucB/RseB C-terminal domain-containing protein [Chromatiaceae bacterium]
MRAGYTSLCFVSLCLTLQGVAAGSAERDVRSWLQNMVESVRALNYRGTFVYLHDNQLESMQIVHTVDAEGEKERLVSLNGSAREVVRDDASVVCIAPDARSISVSRRGTGGGFRAVFSMDVDALSALYDFQLLNQARVAGRDTQAVAILPKDAYRYGYRIYLDSQKALPLKTDMLDDKGSVISQIMFTSIQIDTEMDGNTEGGFDGREYYHWVQREPGKVENEPEAGEWKFAGLPQGYHIRLFAQMPASNEGPPVSHFVLTDGLASLSLYIESSGMDSALIGGSRMGAINAFGRVLDGYQITAVGAVPALTVEKIATAVRRNAD